jgi:hypothetical protein
VPSAGLAASSGDSAEVGEKFSHHANGRVASMIAFECEVTPRVLSSGAMRGSSAERLGECGTCV